MGYFDADWKFLFLRAKMVPRGHRAVMLPLGVGPVYAEKSGGPVLIEQKSWRKISGIRINTNRGCWWIEFRRYSSQ